MTDQDPSESERYERETELAGYLDEMVSAAIRAAAADRPSQRREPPAPPTEAAPHREAAKAEGAAEAEEATEAEEAAPRREAAAKGTSRGSPPPSAGRRRRAAHGWRRDEFLALFGNTERGSAVAPLRPVAAVEPEPTINDEPTAAVEGAQPATVRPSAYLRRFLQQATRSPEHTPSGLANLDAHLAGGFGAGVHLVSGPPGIGKTAFLESVAWESVSTEHPVLYYAFKEGSLGVWKRLASTLGDILGGPRLPLSALRSRTLAAGDLDTLTRLDQALQVSVLPYLSLIETIPSHGDILSAFIEHVRSRVREARERHGRAPLLLVDELDSLMVLSSPRPPGNQLARLDEALAALSVPGLFAMTTPAENPAGPPRLPVRTVLTLVPVAASAHDGLRRVDVKVRTDADTGWTGTLPLLMDRSGLFAAAPEDAKHEPDADPG